MQKNAFNKIRQMQDH